ncbi:ROK family protein [Streptomyces sp. SL13]|uniref:ROK family protein n=1 Tax=Streptantibioticus silvisoli TaxID=2705255 RepID=A0AA90H7V6_9ACTN|nr:ROK family transcriptional regulator [Streptantibioticus silvisoli]MDI5972841.1 ROK family protein [Streptantibioticus silvisoli]
MQQHDGPLARLRRGHEELVLDLLRKHGPLSRGELGARCGLSRTTLYDIVAALVANGAVVASAPQAGPRRRGRPVERLALNPGAGQAIGVDFARRAVHVAAVNVAHEVVGTASQAHGPDLSWPQRIELAERLIGSLAGDSLRLDALSAIGVGVVGPVAWQPADDMPGPPAELVPLLRRKFAVPVLVDNNTRLAALAESTWGTAAGEQDVLYLRLSHGVGGGLVVGGALHRGAYGLSGEFGHITVDPDGGPCECGGTGCLETVASVGAVLEAYRSAGGEAADIAGLTAAARAGEPAAAGVLAAAGRRVGAVLAAVSNAVGPGVIVIGGELAAAGEALTGPVERELSRRLLPVSRHRLDLRPAALGEVGAALGGIALVLHQSPLLSRYPGRPRIGEDG